MSVILDTRTTERVDVEYGFVRRYSVTDAAVHDSIALPDILD